MDSLLKGTNGFKNFGAEDLHFQGDMDETFQYVPLPPFCLVPLKAGTGAGALNGQEALEGRSLKIYPHPGPPFGEKQAPRHTGWGGFSTWEKQIW
jgi:hypothetical protein